MDSSGLPKKVIENIQSFIESPRTKANLALTSKKLYSPELLKQLKTEYENINWNKISDELKELIYQIIFETQTLKTKASLTRTSKRFYNPEKMLEYKKEQENLNNDILNIIDDRKLDQKEKLKLIKQYYVWGANIHYKNDELLRRAVYENAFEIVKFLIKEGANVNAIDSYGWIPLLRASELDDFKIFFYLLEHGANINYVNDENSVLNYILGRQLNHRYEDTTMLRELKKNGFNQWQTVMSPDEWGKSLLMYLVDNYKLQTLKFILPYLTVAQINKQDGYGNTALMYVIAGKYFPNMDIFNLLIQYGADPDIRNERGKTVFDMAKLNGHRIVKKSNGKYDYV